MKNKNPISLVGIDACGISSRAILRHVEREPIIVHDNIDKDNIFLSNKNATSMSDDEIRKLILPTQSDIDALEQKYKKGNKNA